ncbi:MAG: DUF2834 domain-containing protein [Pseudomonadales bacterium]|nr:DUF2834 domain-containing protein [Pseudomonadales bacterium]
MVKVSSKWIFYFYILVSLLAVVFVFAHSQAFTNNGIFNIGPEFVSAIVNNLDPAKAVISMDLFFLALPLMVWVVLEGRRIGLKWPAIYMFAGIFVLTSAAVPLFLAAREHKLSKTNEEWKVYE